MSVYFAPNVVSGFAVLDGQQAHDHIGPTRYERMRPYSRGHDFLPHLKAMAWHDVYLGCHGAVISMHLSGALAYWPIFTSRHASPAVRGWCRRLSSSKIIVQLASRSWRSCGSRS